MQLQEYLTRYDRVVLPVGSTEQHAYLSIKTDNIIAERCRQRPRRKPPEHSAIRSWIASRRGAELVWHDVPDGAPDALAAEIDPDFDHASWSENFPWTRLAGVQIPSTR